MQELLPLALGALAGSRLGLVRPSLRFPIGTLLAIALGAFVTVITGEAAVSAAFLLNRYPARRPWVSSRTRMARRGRARAVRGT
jgi:hypothetical protein